MTSTGESRTGEADPDRATISAFVLLVVLAGGNPVAVRLSSCSECELDPFWGAAIRFLLSAAIFTLIAVVARVNMPRGRTLLRCVLYGALQFGVGFGLLYWGLERTPAGLGQVLLACGPLIAFGLALVHRQERFRWEGLLGGLMAVAGVSLLFASGVDGGVPVSSMFAIVAAAAFWAEALVVVRGSPRMHPAPMNAVAMGVGGLMLLAITLVVDGSPIVPQESRTIAALAYLVLPGAVVVYSLYVFILRRWTASAASYQFVLIPTVTVLLSSWLEDEALSWAFGAGAVLVLGAVYFGALRPASRASKRVAPAAPSQRVVAHDP